ncbi:MAG: ArnT family glycosyltransferase [Actinomycetota bacterium]
MDRRRFARVLAAIATAGLLGRIAYILAVTRDQKPYIDEIYYADTAVHLARGNGFRTPLFFGPPAGEIAEHPPLTSLVLAPAAWITDESRLAMRITMAMAGVAVVVLVALVAARIAGRRAGLIAAVLAACSPNLWVNDGLLMSETLATLATAGAVLGTYVLVTTRRIAAAIATGGACAAAMLTRGELALLLPLMVLPALALMGNVVTRDRLRLAGVTLLAAATPVVPWVAYNLARFEDPVLLSHGDAGVLLGANCDETYGGHDLGYWNGLCALTDRAGDASVDAGEKRDAAFEYMREHAERLPVVVVARVGRMWGVYRPFEMAERHREEGRPEWVSIAGWASTFLFLALAVQGLRVLRRREVPLLPLVAPAAMATLVAAMFYGHPRFRAPAEVGIVVLAAVGIDAYWSRRRGSVSSEAPPEPTIA